MPKRMPEFIEFTLNTNDERNGTIVKHPVINRDELPCPRCYGTGRSLMNPYGGEPDALWCPACKGNGTLKAYEKNKSK